jgi:cellulose synthase/poly-beta-1,6-N-acetylglucosamine synthase-like glycosyltransferase
LDTRVPFTAARARNEGFRRLRELQPALTYVQFVDGDCEVVDGWIGAAAAFLDEHPAVAVACGRRRERFPEQSAYNLLCDIEWDTPVGDATACGGDALMRADAVARAGGYNDYLIAGEEPELCMRLRAAGWQVWRLDREMTLHDAAMTRFAQWWKRNLRAGHAFAEVASLGSRLPGRFWVREARSSLFWGIALPLGASLGAALAGPPALALFAIYPVQVARIALRGGHPARRRWLRAAALVAGKFPEALGHARFLAHRLLRVRPRLIEYK